MYFGVNLLIVCVFLNCMSNGDLNYCSLFIKIVRSNFYLAWFYINHRGSGYDITDFACLQFYLLFGFFYLILLTQILNHSPRNFQKSLYLSIIQYLKIGFDVIFDADSESPRMTQGKNATLRAKNCFLGGHVTSARLNRKKSFISRSGQGLGSGQGYGMIRGIGQGQGYGQGYGLDLKSGHKGWKSDIT